MVTNTDINIDADGEDAKDLSGIKEQEKRFHTNHVTTAGQTSIGSEDGMPINADETPYLVLIDLQMAPHCSNYGVNEKDFGVVVWHGHVQGAQFLDAGHSLGGEASLKVHLMLGRDPGPIYYNAIPKSDGAYVIAFPGSRSGFHQTPTAANVQAYAMKLYDGYLASLRPASPAKAGN